MKNTSFAYAALVGIWALASVGVSLAGPRGNSNFGRDYLVGPEELSAWSTGLFFSQRERNVTFKGTGFPTAMDSTAVTAVLGYDVFPWLTLYGQIGQSRTEFDTTPRDDGKTALGAGVRFNLLDHEIQDPGLMEDRIRLNADCEYNTRTTERFGEDIEWVELAASLTASIVNDVQGDKNYLPESIAIFAGPAYSRIDSSDISDDSDDRMGFTAGLDIFYTKRISMDLRADIFDKTGFSGGLSLRF